VVEENHSADQVIGRTDAPFLNALAGSGLNFTDMHAETHPSEPNYLALLSGSTQGLTDDSCPHTYAADNLVKQLLSHGLSFAGYSESLPSAGYTGCTAYPYARKHVPWVDFSSAPSAVNQPLTAMPANYNRLPTVSFVIPNLLNDMHDGSVARGDTWLRRHLGGYASWSRTHRSLLLVTWDEDDDTDSNHIATIAVGSGIEPATWSHPANHYTLLATIEHSFGLPAVGKAQRAGDLPPIS
jgi:acid phosphatase